MRLHAPIALVLALGMASVPGCGLTVEPSASASLSGDRATSVRISRAAPRPVARETTEATAEAGKTMQ